MQKRIIAAAVLAATPFLGSNAMAQELPIEGNFSVVSDYAFRGISQSNQRPAIQGGFDYAHDSGLYIGTWASSISDGSAGIETNLYGGYTFEAGPFGFDLGLLRYYYPGDDFDSLNTTEAYAGISWEFLSLTYSRTLTDAFGMENSRGSSYYDLSASYEIMDGLTLDAHYGWNRFKGAGNDNYKDWSLGATKSYGGFDFGLHYVDTDISNDKLADARVVFSIGKTF